MDRNVRSSLAPSIRADSRNSGGTARKLLVSNRIESGAVPLTNGSTSPNCVPSTPRSCWRSTTGSNTVTPGTNSNEMNPAYNALRPGNVSTPKAYDASEYTTSTPTTVATV